jgi:hypothetical protein
MPVAVNVEVRSNGDVVLAKMSNDMKTLGDQADKTQSKMGALSKSVGNVSMTMARSADAFGLPTQALRTLNDVSDIAEMGFGNLSKAAAGFNAVSIGVAGAGLAIGAALGTLIRQIPAVEQAADSAAVSLARFWAIASGNASGAIGVADAGMGAFTGRIRAVNDEVMKKHAERLRKLGKSDKEIAAVFNGGGQPPPEHGHEAALRRLGLDKESLAKAEKAEEKAKAAAKKAADERERERIQRARDEMRRYESAQTKFLDAFEISGMQSDLTTRIFPPDIADNISKAQQEMEAFLGPGSAMDDAVLKGAMAKAFRETDEEMKKLVDNTTRWQGALQGIALLAGAIGGDLGATVQVFGNIGEAFQGWATMTGHQKFNTIAGGVGQIGGLIGQKNRKTGGAISGMAGGAMTGAALGSIVPGIGTVVGGVVGGIVGGVSGWLGGRSKEKAEEKEKAEQAKQQFDQLTQALSAQHGSLLQADAAAQRYGVSLKEALQTKNAKLLDEALAMVEKRMNGLKTAIAGANQIVESMTYQDSRGKLFATFTDPKMAEAISGSFASTFWATWQREGAAGIDAMRPQWEKLLDGLARMNVDPLALGLGSIGRLFNLTDDPKTRAILGVAQGSSQLLRGSMDAGFMDRGLLEDQTTLARGTLNALQENGMSSEEAARAQAAQLAALAQAYRATGAELPPDIAGALAEAGIDVLPTQLQVLEESRDYLAIMAGRDGYASGGVVDADPSGEWHPLHGRERIIPEDQYRAMRHSDFTAGRVSGGGGSRVTVNATLSSGSPLQTARDREELTRYQLRELKRAIRTSPEVQRLVSARAGYGR